MKTIKAAMIMVIIFCVGGLGRAQDVWIEIDGLAGAEHWVWVEAETARIGGSGDNNFTYSSLYSNTWDDGSEPANETRPNRIVDSWKAPAVGGNWMEWKFHTPAEMTNGTLFLRYAANNPTGNYSEVHLDGRLVGSFLTMQTTPSLDAWSCSGSVGGYDPCDYRTEFGELSEGAHTVKMVHPGHYCDRHYDGFFIYDGIATDINNDYTVFCNSIFCNGFDQYAYIEPPLSTTDPNGPIIAALVKPVITFHGRDPEVNNYEIKLNGEIFLNGTVIDEPGGYQLVVTLEENYKIIAYAGANFSLGGVSACGDASHQPPAGDLDGNCSVDLADWSVVSHHWLECTAPGPPCNFGQ